VNDVNLMHPDHFTRDAPGHPLAGEPGEKPDREMPEMPRQSLSDAIEETMKAGVGNEMNPIDVGGKKRCQFVARARVDDEPDFSAALAKHAKVMERQNRFATKFRRRMLRHN
jgi:hypothetical protein